MAVPTLTYGTETWIMAARQILRIKVTEIKFLCSIAGYTKLDVKRNNQKRAVSYTHLDVYKRQDVDNGC